MNEVEKQYAAREKRVTDAIRLQKPDRVPIASAAEFFITRFGGLKDGEAMTEYGRMSEAWKKAISHFNWDMSPFIHAIRSGRVMEIMGIKCFKWPQANPPENGYYQWVEAEYMMADEYDEFLKDPADFTIRKVMPRMSTALEPLANIPPIVHLSNGYSLLGLLPNLVMAPGMDSLMSALKQAGEEKLKWDQTQAKLRVDLKEMGYPLLTYTVTFCAFDWISDCLRGMSGSMLDMYRQPDKLKAAVEMVTPITIQAALAGAAKSDIDRIFIPLHRGAAGFMSDKQFAEFYWPCLKELLLAVIDAGLTPVPFFEGDYTPRLEYLTELPPGKVLGHFDRVDRVKFKKLLGDTMCFWGNIPSSLFITGPKQAIMDDVKELIDIFGGEGLIVDASSTGPPPESKPENVEAFTEAVFEYGSQG